MHIIAFLFIICLELVGLAFAASVEQSNNLLAADGAEGASSLVIVASDGYAAIVQRTDWLAGSAVLAMRLNGEPFDDSARRPIVLLWPETERAALGNDRGDGLWV